MIPRKKYIRVDDNRFRTYWPFILSLFFLLVSCSAHMPSAGKAHHTKSGFKNVPSVEDKRFFDFIKWRWSRLWKKLPDADDYDFPRADTDLEFIRSNQRRVALTWVGHATLLLQLEGKNILTDPVFSRRASPVQWAGPRRVVPPGIDFKDLPVIDFVIISHSHYDALDKNSIQQLYARKNGDKTIFLVPLGLKQWFQNLGIERVFELDWWDQHSESGLNFTATPVQHWSKRTIFTRNASLWAGWVIATDRFRFFFSGDSGYTSHFKTIGSKLGPFDLAAIPIGAYEPRWFMREHHMNPEEALQVHLDLRSKQSVAIHWGTFILTDEPLDEPPQRLAAALKKEGIPEKRFAVLRHGEMMILK